MGCEANCASYVKRAEARYIFLAERWGFEPQIPFWGIHDFQSCSFGQLGHLSALPIAAAKYYTEDHAHSQENFSKTQEAAFKQVKGRQAPSRTSARRTF